LKAPKIVIGLGYGDEGKGRTVDFLCAQTPDSIVVRFSGGQQCGHTVMIEDKKHIFSNFGSGTLRGCTTYFSEHTTIYPTTLFKEMNILGELGHEPKLTIHPLANLTTPFDVLANRACEDNLSHGTCGLGVGKTMHRQISSPHKVYAIDLLHPHTLVEKVEKIADWYGIRYSDHTEYVDRWVRAVISIKWDIQDYSFLLGKNLIFEGSQGVLLDMDHGVFPHVTYSSTTSKNAIEICEWLGLTRCDVFGVTRSYHTRHGNGPFKQEHIELKHTEEETNVTNEYQGVFKVGKLDVDLLRQAIETDKIYSGRLNRMFTLVVTCVDQYEASDELLLASTYYDEMLVFSSPVNEVETKKS
jgi:adenylosuccinate synthase